MLQVLPNALPDFTQTSILVVGDVMVDRYWFGDTTRISPEAPVPIVNINNIDNRPGGAGNVALNIAALGTKVTLLSLTGNDEAAHTLAQQLSIANVTHDFCMLDNLSTIIKLRVLSRHQQLLRLDFEKKIISFNTDLLIERYKKHLPDTKLIILSDYQKGTLSNPQAFIQLAHKMNIPVLVDPKGQDFSIYRDAFMVTPNLKEFEAIVGSCQHEQDIIDKGRRMLAEYNIKALLITRGEDGMTLIQMEGNTHYPACAREVFDVTGAGDTVIGVLGAALASQISILSAVALANLAASIAVTKLGAVTVSVPELEAAITGKTNINSGILNEEQLLQAVQEAKALGKKIIFTNGCFDILHAGHVASLQMAKQLGDYLIVAVNTDESIRKLKGANRPINHLEHRMSVLAGLDVVDWVIPFADSTPERLLRLIQPDFLAKGSDYRLDQVVGADIVRAYGGEVRIMNPNINLSSTTIIDKIEGLALQGDNSL
ncbi:MAG: bifunctional heptose 7-phosphate kinase/heptose 1-phosphate adenyltransferase [Gammaproteobacteria bacterium RIFCSPHIGHO2_12_FULL_37_14]|nr:MAG: bifunctional heptose 7-phosphate kinase/heptose 1-phosphate adenyltransferase [Gammaproteobacteria bacterium RIFCSPHIGHO2_12_FULL_37_14]